jgi:hypothetical protein
VGNNLDPSIYEAAHVKIKKLVKSLTTRKLRRLLLPLPNLKSPFYGPLSPCRISLPETCEISSGVFPWASLIGGGSGPGGRVDFFPS